VPTLRAKIADLDQQLAAAHEDVKAAQALPFYGSRKASRLQAVYLRIADLERDRARLQGFLDAAVRGRAA
jgi:hypothetical protein